MILNKLFFVIFIITTTIQSYSFCPKCVHYYTTTTNTNTNSTPTKPNCNLFKRNPLFKDRPDVDFIGKEICTIKGKYFKPEVKDDDNDEYIVAS